MNILDSILEKWKNERSVENLISEGLFTDKDAIQAALDNTEDSERAGVIAQLAEIQESLLEHIQSIEAEQALIKGQIDATYKSAKACLSYGSSINIQNKGKE